VVPNGSIAASQWHAVLNVMAGGPGTQARRARRATGEGRPWTASVDGITLSGKEG
jgi:hypothetical protein